MSKRPSRTATSITAFCVAALVAGGVAAQSTSTTFEALVDSREIPVTIGNFVRAATDVEFAKYVSFVGG